MSMEWLSLHGLYALLWLVAFFALLGRLSEIRQSCRFPWINIRFRLTLLLHQSVLAG